MKNFTFSYSIQVHTFYTLQLQVRVPTIVYMDYCAHVQVCFVFFPIDLFCLSHKFSSYHGIALHC